MQINVPAGGSKTFYDRDTEIKIEVAKCDVSLPSEILIPVIKKTRLDKGSDAPLSSSDVIEALQKALEMDDADRKVCDDLIALGLKKCTRVEYGLHSFLALKCDKKQHKKLTDLVTQQLKFVLSLFEDGLVDEALYFLAHVSSGRSYNKPCFDGSGSFWKVLVDTHSALEFESHLANEMSIGGEARAQARKKHVTEQKRIFHGFITNIAQTSKCSLPTALKAITGGGDSSWNRVKLALLPLVQDNDGSCRIMTLVEFNDDWVYPIFSELFEAWVNGVEWSWRNWIVSKSFSKHQQRTWCQACQVALWGLPIQVLGFLIQVLGFLKDLVLLSIWIILAHGPNLAHAFLLLLLILGGLLRQEVRIALRSVYRFIFAPLRPSGWYKRSVVNGAYLSRYMSEDWADDNYVKKHHFVENTVPRGGLLPVVSKLLLQRKFFVLGECFLIFLLHYADTITDILVVIQWHGKGYTGATAMGITTLVLPILFIGAWQLIKTFEKISCRKRMLQYCIENVLTPDPELLDSSGDGAAYKAIFVDFLLSATNLQIMLETVRQLRLEANDEARSSEGGPSDLQMFKFIEAVLEALPSSTVQLYIMVSRPK
jgi:hypothetical protein